MAGIALISVLLLAGCTSPAANLPDAPRENIPPLPIAEELPPYRIQVGDVLAVKMLLNPELDEDVTVRPDGKISTTVAQDIPAFGKTPEELQKDIDKRYKVHLSNPEAAVIVRTFAPTRVYVLGEVSNPGEYISVGPNLTLLQAVARAGGVKNSALTDDIVILRRGSADRPQAYAANYNAAASGNDPTADVRLMPYDVVYVPRTGVAEAYVGYEQYFKQFVNPGLGFGYSLNP